MNFSYLVQLESHDIQMVNVNFAVPGHSNGRMSTHLTWPSRCTLHTSVSSRSSNTKIVIRGPTIRYEDYMLWILSIQFYWNRRQQICHQYSIYQLSLLLVGTMNSVSSQSHLGVIDINILFRCIVNSSLKRTVVLRILQWFMFCV